ncbi:MAG: molecular chaperone DnaJ [Chloroflexi bacterium]|nr:molecular chaperone DnaJ [Chloroflexota bacterium]
MTTKRDYYEILEVGREASEEDIRKAFRQKALEFHPDRNKEADAGAKFKEVNEAYQVLTDPERRQQYDRFGHAGTGSGGGRGAGGFDTGDVFGGFGDIFDAFFGGGPRTQSRNQPGQDLQTTITVAFKDAVFGVTKEIEIERREKCTRCEGSRSEPGHNASACSNCKGSGRVRRAQRSVFGQFVTEAACNVCGGTGQQISNPCTQCRGSGRERAKSKIKVQVPAGIPAGATLNLRGQGDSGERGAPSGDLYVGIRIQPHEEFQREENDILYDLELTYPQAALGLELEVPTLEELHKIKIPAGTQNGEVFRIKDKGVPHLGREHRRGDELVTVLIATPDKLSKRQKELLEELQRSFTDDK